MKTVNILRVRLHIPHLMCVYLEMWFEIFRICHAKVSRKMWNYRGKLRFRNSPVAVCNKVVWNWLVMLLKLFPNNSRFASFDSIVNWMVIFQIVSKLNQCAIRMKISGKSKVTRRFDNDYTTKYKFSSRFEQNENTTRFFFITHDIIHLHNSIIIRIKIKSFSIVLDRSKFSYS